MTLDIKELEDAASALTTLQHIAAYFRCSVDDLKPYIDVINQARLREVHNCMADLRLLAHSGDPKAMAHWIELSHMKNLPANIEDAIEFTDDEIMKILAVKD